MIQTSVGQDSSFSENAPAALNVILPLIIITVILSAFVTAFRALLARRHLQAASNLPVLDSSIATNTLSSSNNQENAIIFSDGLKTEYIELGQPTPRLEKKMSYTVIKPDNTKEMVTVVDDGEKCIICCTNCKDAFIVPCGMSSDLNE